MKTKPKKTLGQMLRKIYVAEAKVDGGISFFIWEDLPKATKEFYERMAKKFLDKVNAE